MKKVALIVAGGSGKRMNSKIPKQFEILQGKPVLMHTFEAFVKSDSSITFVLVLPEIQFNYWKTLCEDYHFRIEHELAAGGKTRFHSVRNGLRLVPDDSIVFIHDGVRPLVSSETIENCYQTALQKGNALPVIPVTESLRKVENSKNSAVDRSKFFLVQTPQTFQSQIIKFAYNQCVTHNFTDDASVLENSGEKIHLVKGNRENIKITYLQDITIAGAFLKSLSL